MEFDEKLGNNLLLTEEPLGGDMTDSEDELGDIPSGKTPKPIPPSRIPFDRKGFSQYQAQTLDSKRETLRQQWLDVTYLILSRAEPLAKTLAKKDFGRMVQLLTSAGIAYDKVFPKGETLSVNLAINMFKGLPSGRILSVLGPSATPCEGIPLVDNKLLVNSP